MLGIKTPSMNTAVENLSGGNQQKVVVAKLAATEPKVLVLDEPTQGVDVQAKVELLRIVDQLEPARRGRSAVVSDELNELMDICDRIVVFYRGRIIREFRKGRDTITAARLLAAIEGETVETIDEASRYIPALLDNLIWVILDRGIPVLHDAVDRLPDVDQHHQHPVRGGDARRARGRPDLRADHRQFRPLVGVDAGARRADRHVAHRAGHGTQLGRRHHAEPLSVDLHHPGAGGGCRLHHGRPHHHRQDEQFHRHPGDAAHPARPDAGLHQGHADQRAGLSSRRKPISGSATRRCVEFPASSRSRSPSSPRRRCS